MAEEKPFTRAQTCRQEITRDRESTIPRRIVSGLLNLPITDE